MATKKRVMSGHWKKQFDYEYLGAYSLADTDEENTSYTPVNVTIKKLGRKMVKNERGQEDCFVCWFEEAVGGEKKPMIINKVNSKVMDKLYGYEISKWIGEKIQLWVDLEVKAQGGEITKGLRWRDPKTAIPKAKTKPQLNPSHPKWNDAIKSLKAGTIDIAGLEKHFIISKANIMLLKKNK